jgi:hypothetical protein
MTGRVPKIAVAPHHTARRMKKPRRALAVPPGEGR